ncbi:MAG: DUF485 domain-containing protein [Pseudomonadota bacterium]
MQHLYKKIYANPEFHELEQKRGKFSWTLASITLVIYFSFILVIAFAPELFAKPIFSDSVITFGIPAGLSVIFLSFILTGIYVYRANKEFDQLSKDIIDQIKGDEV